MYRFRAQRGFTLVEALVAVLVGVIALLGLYALVDASNKLTKQETEVAEVQQSTRIGVSELSRVIRQSRVGGLYFGNSVLPIANNISGPNFYTDISSQKHYIRAGTDVIEVRGIFVGDRYVLDEGDVTCTPACPPNQVCPPCQSWAVRIPWRTALGYVNFPLGGSPSLATRTRSFYFAVVSGENQQVTVNSSTYLVPTYAVGYVSVNPSASPCTLSNCTLTSDSLTFEMSPQNTGARELNATTTLPSSLAKSIGGGAIDVVRFFVDEGGSPANNTTDTHPSLAEATLDPSTGGPGNGRWDVQPLIEEVEDFQIAYGVDGSDGSTPDGGVSPTVVDLSGTNRDEWVGNVATEVETRLPIVTADANHSGVDAFIDTSIPSGPSPRPAAPALHSIWISLVVKSSDPDFVYNGPGARGVKILDSAAVSFSTATGRPYRRRPLSLAVSLRNNGLYDRTPTPAPTPTP
jgi:prepilin-type N-terminal cleavage/methylation domain-containing protein